MMNKRTTDVVAYLTWVGLLLAFALGDRESCKFHLNQSFLIWLVGTLLGFVAKVPLFGWIIGLVGGVFCALCWFIGIVSAIQGTEKEVPLLGHVRLIH